MRARLVLWFRTIIERTMEKDTKWLLIDRRNFIIITEEVCRFPIYTIPWIKLCNETSYRTCRIGNVDVGPHLFTMQSLLCDRRSWHLSLHWLKDEARNLLIGLVGFVLAGSVDAVDVSEGATFEGNLPQGVSQCRFISIKFSLSLENHSHLYLLMFKLQQNWYSHNANPPRSWLYRELVLRRTPITHQQYTGAVR